MNKHCKDFKLHNNLLIFQQEAPDPRGGINNIGLQAPIWRNQIWAIHRKCYSDEVLEEPVLTSLYMKQVLYS